MAMSLNKVTIIGNLGKDPETRSVGSGSVVNLTLACSEKFKKDGEWKDKTEWINVVIWNENAQKLCEYLSKGQAVYVEGKMQTRKWTDKNGDEKYTTEVVVNAYDGKILLLEKKETEAPVRDTKTVGRRPARVTDNIDDEIPF